MREENVYKYLPQIHCLGMMLKKNVGLKEVILCLLNLKLSKMQLSYLLMERIHGLVVMIKIHILPMNGQVGLTLVNMTIGLQIDLRTMQTRTV